ncbi:apolipoprotein N-acyltransferase [Anthocerotibacter panamensis]|uniref:apolipoprotein N-acyltransferase n=1 Tax=Anthocerotibacter panamensis TaxID=2857077 RepID=UPI001C403E12|nr:apolipoprotein N-acyltransferase [Anthocerotibacter panamensis]
MSGASLPKFGLKFTAVEGAGWAILTGLLLALAAPPVGCWPLAWVAFIPLWGWVRAGVVSPLKTLLVGGLAGLVYHLGLLYWLLGVHPLTWMGISYWPSLGIAVGLWLVVSAFEGLAWGIWAWLMSWTRGWRALEQVIWGVGTWLLVDGLWASGPLGFPWGTVAATQANGFFLPLVQLGGSRLLTALVLLVNGLLLVGLRERRYLGVALGLGLVAGLWRGLTPESGPTLTVGVIQANIPQARRVAIGPQAVMDIYTRAYREVARLKPDIAITPEAAIAQIWNAQAQLFSPLGQAIQTERVPLLLGAYDERGRQLSNSLFATGGGVFDKVNLVPLNDTVPFEPYLGWLIAKVSPLYGNLYPGASDQVFTTPVGIVAAGICYDAIFPEVLRGQTARGARWLVTVTNDSWFGPGMPTQRQAIETLRAVENGRWLVRASNTGSSGAIDPLGRTVHLTTRDTYQVFTVRITPQSQLTPYTRWGDTWTVSIVLAMGAVVVTRLNSRQT